MCEKALEETFSQQLPTYYWAIKAYEQCLEKNERVLKFDGMEAKRVFFFLWTW